MQILKMPVTELIAPQKNVRIHTEVQIKEFIRSIAMFGQIRPVVVDENNVILAGNGLVAALKKAGIETADVYKITNLSEKQKKKLMIADNKIYGLGIENLDTLNAFLEELSDDLDIPGFDEEILKSMVAEADSVTEKLSQYGTLDDDEIQNIKDSAARKEERIAQVSQPKPITQQAEQEAAPVKKTVTCPDCGAVICL